MFLSEYIIKQPSKSKHKRSSSNKNSHFCSCRRIFTKEASLNYHQKWECGRQFECRKHNCNGVFNTISGLCNHLKKIHKSNIKKEDYE